MTIALCLARSPRSLIDGRRVFWFRHGFGALFGHFQPSWLGDLHVADSLLGGVTNCGTVFQVRNVGNIAGVVVAVEHVNVIILHCSSPFFTIVPVGRRVCQSVSFSCIRAVRSSFSSANVGARICKPMGRLLFVTPQGMLIPAMPARLALIV